ncbi:MAG: class II aldolase/adducin family protein [Myxococcota bacterium]
MYDEGVIKFAARHETRALEERTYLSTACELIAWREILAQTGLVGQDPRLYGGAGYGNVSARVPPFGETGRGRRRFLITGTQTGGSACMGLGQFCVVTRYDVSRNEVDSFGEILPSSESMTHGALYDLAPSVRYVLHAHSPIIWRQAKELKIPTTPPEVPYGTPQMARAVETLYQQSTLPEVRILAMGGHEDGIVVFGRTADEAGAVMMRHLAAAYGRVCDANRVLC